MTEVTAKSIEQLLTSTFNPIYKKITDFSNGCGQNMEVLLVSDHFEGKSLVTRHRMVNEVLGRDTFAVVHSLVLVSLDLFLL